MISGQNDGHSFATHSCNTNLLSRRTSEGLSPQRRQFAKKSRSGKHVREEESGSEDEEEYVEKKDDVVGTGFADGTVACNTLRIDAVAKTAMNLARHTIEEAFMEGRLRLNGCRITRKSEWVNETDYFDLIKGRNRDNMDNLDVHRVEIRSIPEISETGKIKIRIRRYKNLTIPNYTADPWMGSDVAEEK